jgi:hypothetical protein
MGQRGAAAPSLVATTMRTCFLKRDQLWGIVTHAFWSLTVTMNDSKMYEVKAISEAAIIRAEKASPSGRRCLVENIPKEWNVEVAHVFARERSYDSKRVGIPYGHPYIPELTYLQMTAIEWSWNMRKSTLNLDTRRNVFFCERSRSLIQGM